MPKCLGEYVELRTEVWYMRKLYTAELRSFPLPVILLG